MSIRLMTRVFDMPGLPATTRLVLLKMADNADDDGTRSYPGHESLALAASVKDVRTVREHVNILERLGLVQEVQRFRRGNAEYRLSIPYDPACADWGELASQAREAERSGGQVDWSMKFGWFNQDRTPGSGQGFLDLDDDSETPVTIDVSTMADPVPDQDRTPRSGLDQDRIPGASRPDPRRVKTGSGDPVAKGNHPEPPRTFASPATRNELWDLLADEFFGEGDLTSRSKKRLGATIRVISEVEPTLDDVRARLDRWESKWPGMTLTLEAFAKWFDELDPTRDPRIATDCDRCGNRRQLARLFDGTVAPFGSDQAEAVGVDYPIRCPDCLPARATEQLRAMP